VLGAEWAVKIESAGVEGAGIPGTLKSLSGDTSGVGNGDTENLPLGITERYQTKEERQKKEKGRRITFPVHCSGTKGREGGPEK